MNFACELGYVFCFGDQDRCHTISTGLGRVNIILPDR